MASGVIECITEDFYFLHESKAVVIRCHLQHDTMFDIEQDLSAVAIFPNKHVQSVTVRHEPEKTRLSTKRDRRIALDVEMSLSRLNVVRQQSIAETEQLHNTLILTDILVTFENMGMRLAIAALHLQFTRALLGLNDGSEWIK